MANTNTAHETTHDEYGRRFGHHTANRMQHARQLRQQAMVIQEDVESWRCWIVERAERWGWNDAQVVNGDEECCRLERTRDALLREARDLEMGLAG